MISEDYKFTSDCIPEETESEISENFQSFMNDYQNLTLFMDRKSNSFRCNLKFNINIFSDEHGRGLAVILLKYFSNKINKIFSMVKPNAKLCGVLSGLIRDRFTKIDNVIIIGGSNDICIDGGMYFFTKLEVLLNSLSETNLWLCTLPHRFDLNEKCIEHYYIQSVNNRIKDISNRLPHVEVIDLSNLQRHHFTKHGFHINKRGKRRLSRTIFSSILCKHLKDDESAFPNLVKRNSLQISANSIQLPEKDILFQVESSSSSKKDWGSCQNKSGSFRQIPDSNQSSLSWKGWEFAILDSFTDINPFYPVISLSFHMLLIKQM